MWTVAFWKDAGERAIRTTAQSIGATVVAAGTALLTTDWVGAVSTGVMAGVISLLFSLGGEVVKPTGTASFTHAVVPAPRRN